jgi:hypothetical protein
MQPASIGAPDVQVELEQWVTPKGFIEEYPQFTLSQIFWVIRQRKINGLEESGAVTLFGRKHYVNKQLFTHWFHNRAR